MTCLGQFLEQYRHLLGEGDLDAYIANPDNIALFDSQNATLLTYARPGIYFGHYFYTARGRDALRLAQTTLRTLFHDYPVICIQGLTPVDNRPARWMSRQLGFKSNGVLETKNGMCELFLLTKEDWLRDR